jgi:hypothetical protein
LVEARFWGCLHSHSLTLAADEPAFTEFVYALYESDIAFGEVWHRDGFVNGILFEKHFEIR